MMKILKTINEDKSGWILALMIFFSMQPYFVWNVGSLSYGITFLAIILLIKDSSVKQSYIIVLWCFVALWASLCGRNNFFGLIMLIVSTTLIFMQSDIGFRRTYNKVYQIYTSLIAVSMIVWVLVVLVGIPLPYKIMEPIIADKDYNYSVYPFLVRTNLSSISYESLSDTFRFCGLFDEPGVVGTLSFLFLCIERFDMSKKRNIILIISGIISMSLFFYLAATVIFLYQLLPGKRFKGRAKIVASVVFLLLVIFSLNNNVLHTLIWSRLEINNTAQSLVDSRSSEELKRYVYSIIGTPDFFFGVSDRSLVVRYSSSASVYNIIINYGFCIIVLYLLFFYIYARQKTNVRSTLLVISIILLTIIQRPGLFLPYFLILFRALSESYTTKSESKLNNTAPLHG